LRRGRDRNTALRGTCSPHPLSEGANNTDDGAGCVAIRAGRVGIAAGFIPHVHIGQRCVVGLGFFGCNLSKLPEANGHLLDGMQDPNRWRSSVPDVDTTSALDPPPD
jgi:hypothetical protein